MALLRCSWLCWAAALEIWLLVFATEPNETYASSRGIFMRRKIITVPQTQTEQGICAATAVTTHGYKCQEFYVTTPDGYIINVQRIPEGRTGDPAGTKRQPVIVQHGVLCDATSWYVNSSPEQSLPTILADNGFDVWIPSARGTRHSRRHLTLNPKQKAYWDWSWDELVNYELQAIFDYVHEQTGQKIHYVGHSLGTLMGLVSFSERKSVDKLQSAAMLSPIAHLNHMTTVLGNLAARLFISEAMELLGIAEFNIGDEQIVKLVRNLCEDYPGVTCYDLLSALTGKNCCLNSSTAGDFFKNYPQSSSTKTIIHLSQAIRSGVLTKFDYVRPEENRKHYGAPHPPAYNLSNIPNDLPLFLGHGGADALSDPRDVAILINEDLKFHDKDKLFIKYIDDYAHDDFIMAINAKERLYDPLISFFKLHQS